jgi:hypothetical protein
VSHWCLTLPQVFEQLLPLTPHWLPNLKPQSSHTHSLARPCFHSTCHFLNAYLFCYLSPLCVNSRGQWLFYCLFFEVLGIELRALSMLGKDFATWITLPISV